MVILPGPLFNLDSASKHMTPLITNPHDTLSKIITEKNMDDLIKRKRVGRACYQAAKVPEKQR
jgi:hypothetical protein